MANLDILAPNYRRAQQRWSKAPTLTKCYEALTVCFSENTHGLVEHVKSFIESVCHTIIVELNNKKGLNSRPTTTHLVVTTLDSLGFHNTRGANKLDKVLSGFNKLSDALTEMRNEEGPVAHGKDGFLDTVSIDHARVFLHVGDAIVGMLLNALEGKQPDLRVTREPYENFSHLNTRIDQTVNIQVQIDEDNNIPIVIFIVEKELPDEEIEIRVEASRLLYELDREAYIEILETTHPVITKNEVNIGDIEASYDTSSDTLINIKKATIEIDPAVSINSKYSDKMKKMNANFESFLITQKVDLTKKINEDYILVDSLLDAIDKNMLIDWQKRPQVQAKIKIACKRILIQFEFSFQEANKIASSIIEWLRNSV